MTTENQETPNDKLTFPLKFSKCPNCGSNRRPAEIVANEQKAKGKMAKEQPIAADRNLAIIADIPTVIQGLSMVPVLTYLGDTCADCGLKYTVEVQRQDLPASEVQKLMGMAPRAPQAPPGTLFLNREQRRHGNS